MDWLVEPLVERLVYWAIPLAVWALVGMGARAMLKKYPWLMEHVRAGVYLFIIGLVVVLLYEMARGQFQVVEHVEKTGRDSTQTILRQLDTQTPDRPYFTLSKTEVSRAGDQHRILAVTVQNSAMIAEQAETYLLVLDKQLSPLEQPRYAGSAQSVNPVSSTGTLRHSALLPSADIQSPVFVVFRVRYFAQTDVQHQYTQVFFLRFEGASSVWGNIFFDASPEERGHIDAYIHAQALPVYAGAAN